jgi:uncharacterized protein (DUF983 family)
MARNKRVALWTGYARLAAHFLEDGIKAWARIVGAEWSVRWKMGLIGGVLTAVFVARLTEPMDVFGHPRNAISSDEAVRLFPQMAALIFLIVVLAPFRGSGSYPPSYGPAPVVFNPARARCPSCGAALTFDQIKWLTPFPCPACAIELKVASSLWWIARVGALVLSAIAASVIGLRGWSFFIGTFVGTFVTGIWLVALLRLLRIRIPVELK